MIRVTQFDSTQESSFVPPTGGMETSLLWTLRPLTPPGCLQYIYGETIGTISSFNLKDSSSTHLSNQRYAICWRRERAMCSLCFSAGLYGLSNVPSSVNSSPWTKKAGYTDSICCNKDNPVSNCGTSGGWLAL